MRTFKNRASDVGRARSRRLAERYGQELRVARVQAGLTQAQLARIAAVSQQEVSNAELGNTEVSLAMRCQLAAAAGHELGLRLYPVASVPLRDSGQLGVATVIVQAAHPIWTPRLEVPVAPGDLRAADILMAHPLEIVEVEVERGFADFQGQVRSGQVKREVIAERESRPVRLVIAVPDTRAIRAALEPYAELIARALPVPSGRIWHAIRTGEPIGGDGILFVRLSRSAHSHGAPAPNAAR